MVKDSGGKLAIRQTQNADCPITEGEHPIVVADVWEHAYYIDYRNARPKYLEALWNGINWGFASACWDDEGTVGSMLG